MNLSNASSIFSHPGWLAGFPLLPDGMWNLANDAGDGLVINELS
jgi:hypothetical protein